ncbi:class I SAM-dependent methyltransferase [Rhodoferax sp.]|uniref:class I SAM-dependent methyltransferase n=1 Tax=Rhodoferax sp. TaxID=50421 RepID=UPI003424D43C
MCESERRTLAHRGVKDWAFACAPGSWNYWLCDECSSLYLDPRPTAESIWRAYSTYYTHKGETVAQGVRSSFKLRLRNECLFHWLGIDQGPRLHYRFGGYLSVLKPMIPRKFPLDQLACLPRGKLLDVGCGSGDLLLAAQAMGWQVRGLEIDAKAVDAACSKGLSVQHGSFELLCEYRSSFECIVCSHVIEHVHEPRQLLSSLVNALKPGGSLFIAYPNPSSVVRRWFGRHWRGLEAPRHLCLPSLEVLQMELGKFGIRSIKVYPAPIHTFEASMRAKLGESGWVVRVLNKLLHMITSVIPLTKHQDIIEIVCD